MPKPTTAISHVARAATLYTPEVLALAVSLAAYPFAEDFAHHGTARSASCGSSLRVGLDLDEQGRVTRIGLRSQACAIGQAAAAIFAGGVQGIDREGIGEAAQQIAAWLSGAEEEPAWPGLAAIAAAIDYPGRHGAVLLPWRAALDALPSAAAQG